MNIFEEIKVSVPISKVLAFYGVEMNRDYKILCPFHNEKTPSFIIYPKSNTWHCFGCGVGGSVIDFVMNFFGINALEAAKKLDSDFNLGLFNKEASQEEINRQSEQRAERHVYKELSAAFDSYMNKVYTILCDYLHFLNEWKTSHAPRSENEAYNPLFIEACHNLDYIEYLIDYLLYASFEEQMQYYEAHRKEMSEIARKIKRYSKSTSVDESA